MHKIYILSVHQITKLQEQWLARRLELRASIVLLFEQNNVNNFT